MTLAMHLPEDLRRHTSELGPALATPILANWDPDEKYHDAKPCEEIGRVLVDRLEAHAEIKNASIAYIFREKMKTRDREVWGKASKADGRLSFFNGFDFVIEINWQVWKRLSDLQRVALIDHELSHCTREQDDNGKYHFCLASHDLEEFGGVVERWGLWRQDLMVFAGKVAHAHQMGLGFHD